jgi:hypothetical protein
MNRALRTFLVGGILLAPVFALGCNPVFVVTRGEDLYGKSVTVHLVGVTETEYAKWYGKSMTEYWDTNDALRNGAVKGKYCYQMDFTGSNNILTLSPDGAGEQIWEAWQKRGAVYLFVLADLPGEHKDSPGNADDRRLILPLEGQHWPWMFWGKTEIPITINGSGINCPRKHDSEGLSR